MKKIVIVHDDDLGKQLIYDATKNLRYEVGGHELVGMVVVDVNRNALGEIVLFVEMPGDKFDRQNAKDQRMTAEFHLAQGKAWADHER